MQVFLQTHYNKIIAVLGIAGFGVILLNTYLYGAGLSPDSVTYISVARELVAGNGFITSDNDYLVYHPPLYPLLLAALSIICFTDPLRICSLFKCSTFWNYHFLFRYIVSYFSG